MDEKKWETYLDEVLSFVKFKYDHKAIRRELTEHMEDLKEDLMAEGMDEAAAEYMTVEYMGEAAEIGQELDKEHHALFGWIWRITRLAFIVILIVCMPAVGSAISFVTGSVSTYFRDYHWPYEEKGVSVLNTVDVDESIWIDDVKLTIDKIRYLDDGEIDICYSTFYRKNGRLHIWEGAYYKPWKVTDEKGNIGTWQWKGSSGSSIYRKHVAGCLGIPQEAEMLHITLGQEWDNRSIDVPLHGKEAAE